MENILCAKNLTFMYNEKLILNDISFDVQKNSITAVLGSNNCGKTTLIKILCGILLSNGEIYINDLLLESRNSKLLLLNIGVVLSDIDKQFLFGDVESELAFSLENLKYSRSNINEAIDMISGLLGIGNIIFSKTRKLTRYQKVLVLIGASIIHNPRVLFLDDIFKGLTQEEVASLFDIFKTLVEKRDLSIIFTTSNVIDILGADRVIVMNNGKILFDDVPASILEHDNELAKIGVNIPTMIDLSMKLKFYNLVDKVYLNTDEVVDKLWS